MVKIRQVPLLQRLTGPFRRLQWKLTLAYTLFTVATILILGIIGVSWLWYLNFQSNWLPSLMADALTKTVNSPAPYLEQNPPDRAALQDWLQKVTPGDYMIVQIRQDGRTGTQTVPAQLGRVVLAAIVDRQGRVLAAVPAGQVQPDTILLSQLDTVESERLQTALAGQTDSSQLSARRPGGSITATAPLFGRDRQVVGAIFTRLTLPINEGEFLTQVLQSAVLPVGLAILVAGLLASLLFGYLIARGLTGRLGRLAEAADIWSQGDFSVMAGDASGDELGQLAGRLNRMAEQLETLLQTRQQLATLEERNRLARDLHDSVKQQVFATAMQVGAARALVERNPATAQTHLVEAENLVRQAQKELTALIQELRPAALEGKGLVAALREYTTDWSRQCRIAVEVRVQGERPLPLGLEQTLFRVVQEALTNAARHSKTNQVEIHLNMAENEVSLTVSDDGQGFNPALVTGKGLGLRSMRERMEAIGGRLTIESSPAEGTRVTAWCKLPTG